MEKHAKTFKDIWDSVVSFFSVSVDNLNEYLGKEFEPDLAKEKEELVLEEEQKDQKEEPPIEQEILVQEIEEEVGEVEANPYKIIIPPELEARFGDPRIDHSYSTLMYLESLGYDRVDWMLNPAEDREYDICDELATQTFTVTGILRNAEEDAQAKGYPVAPIFWLSHPGCMCYLQVWAPNTPEEIPDDAPGLHMWADPEQLSKEKEELWNTLETIVEVDRSTLPPQMFKAITHTHLNHNRTKESVIKNWMEDIKPIKITGNIFVRTSSDLIQLIFKDSRGFQLENYKDIARVFLYEYGRDFVIPESSFTLLEVELSSKKVEEGDFVIVDGGIGLSYGQIDEELLVYDPDYNSLIRADEWQVLEMK